MINFNNLGCYFICKSCRRFFFPNYKFQKFCSIKCANRLNPINQPRPVKLPRLINNKLAEFLGILSGDGCISSYFLTVTLNAKVDNEYGFIVEKLAQDLFKGSKVTKKYLKRDNTISIQISSKVVVKFLKSIWPQRKKVPSCILQNRSLHIPYARGLIDTEGSVGFKFYQSKNGIKIYKQLTFTNYSPAFQKFIYNTFKMVGLKPTFPSRNIYISNNKDIQKCLRIFRFHNQKINKRANINTYDQYLDFFNKLK